jgi:uncharacterized protein YcfJ
MNRPSSLEPSPSLAIAFAPFHGLENIVRIISILSATTMCVAVSVSAAPAMAAHHRHHHGYRHEYRTAQRQDYGCAEARRRSGNNGTVLGAVAGGVLGNQLAGSGSRTTGTLLGAGGGALIGHQIGKSNHPC